MRSSVAVSVSVLSFILPALGAFLKAPTPPEITHDNVATIGNDTFAQHVSHMNHSLGTFSQRYWYSTEFWKGPGSPIVLFTPGEIAADRYTGYLTNKTITGLFAEAIGGAVVMIEHRYWGESSPYDVLSTKNMQYLTLKESILDLVHFSKTVKLLFDEKSSNSDKAPWVLSGGSYSGALAAWTESEEPGVFWAYHSSSAPVEAIYDYWQYFAPVQEGMAKNCSKDVSLVVDYVDQVLTTGSATDKTTLKSKFGLEAVEHDDDFASVLANGPYLWQSNSFTTGYSGFFQWCDAVENVTAGQANTPDANGVGLEVALAGYANWVNTTILPGYCLGYGYTDPTNLSCFNTYNASNPMYTDLTVGNPYDRQWIWMLCNEPFAYWQDGAPSTTPSIVSRLVTAPYWQRQCGLFFPPSTNDDGGFFTYGSSPSHRPQRTPDNTPNHETDGWLLPARADATTRLIWTNGEFDPWRTAGVSSAFRPGGPLVSSPEAPVQVIPGGFHCSDLRASNGVANEGVQKVIDNEVGQIKAWVGEYYQK